MVDILVVPDAHVRPGISTQRFKALGNYIAEHQPEYVVQLGDWADMASLCSYDQGRKEFEGRTYKNDILAVNESIHVLEDAIDGKWQRSKKKRTYFPKKIVLRGNHEERILRAVSLDAKLDGVITYKDFDFAKFGWREVDFLESVTVEGISISHYFVSGLMGKAIGGEHPAASLIAKQFKSCITGHSHLFDFAERTDADGRKIMALVAGWFGDPSQVEAYAGPSQKMWRNCITHLRDVNNGEFDFETISTQRLTTNY